MIIRTLTIIGLFIFYSVSDGADRDCLLFGAVIVAIDGAAERIIERISTRGNA